jgi:hypothetical protein
MQSWEYKMVEVRNNAVDAVDGQKFAARAAVPALLTELGADGWELTGVAGAECGCDYTLFFKRPKG